MTRNVFLDARKSRAGRDRSLEESLEPSDHETSADAPVTADAAFLREEERRRVWAALRQLPEEFRSTLVLFDIEGLSYDEVAAVVRVPLGTVKSRIARGREHLRRLLKEEAAPPRVSGNLPALAVVPQEGSGSA